ncbi:hypothetical protein K1W69_24420 [Hoeflea sp. WL0058]|uniref:TolB amino-terminal domain-containing protein n=1 Tax=Flavimaribacter sediminis TaxID=2865987 RepID=A0AAE3D311_9HYPH|nr:hypothetical protein [Flavimaribacter sediminis]MBW8640359.1 hypothetical protein [Flavimaribacter sediminis]
MGEESANAHLGLPWPEAYMDLKPLLQEKWGVGNEIYLHHKLSGKSGAAVYTTDINSSEFNGQAILKFDHSSDSGKKERDEDERHQLAYETAPEYAATHLPRILHTLHHGDSLAILSTIAGQGLEFATPWAECSHRRQLSVVLDLSLGLLEGWNAGYTFSEGLRSPQDLLWNWLDYRMDPNNGGRIHAFVNDTCGVAPDDSSFVFEGRWYPNPLAFAARHADFGSRLRLRAVMGQSHGDLHGYNVLASTAKNSPTTYYLIDLAMYENSQFLFYDHAYFEISHLLMSREYTDATNWQSLLYHLRPFEEQSTAIDPRGDDLGLLELMKEWQNGLTDWVRDHHQSRISYMQNQYLLARVAAGLNFTHKMLPDKSRRMAFLFAAQNLKDYLNHNSIDWPKHGSNFILSVPSSETVVSTSAAPPQSDAPHASRHRDTEHPPLPAKPSIAVLAFKNLSGDVRQERFSDGVTQEIITALSHVDWLMVISRGSSFTYKDQEADVMRIGQELGVHYVVTGSVRKARSRIRISVQLIDARTGQHIWAERFDDAIVDVFDLQEQIADTIAANIDSQLKLTERQRTQRSAEHLGVWERYQDALWHVYRATDDHTEHAKRLLTDIIKDTPNYSAAHALRAIILCRDVTVCVTDMPEKDLEIANQEATLAVSLDETDSLPRVAFSRVLMLQGQTELAIDQAEEAVALNPSSSMAVMCLALAHIWNGDAAGALAPIDMSIRLSPKGPFHEFKHMMKCMCLYMLGDIDEAARVGHHVATGQQTGPVGPMIYAAILVRQKRLREAADIIARLHEAWPGVTLDHLKKNWKSMHPDYLAALVTDLAAAGLPE